MLFRSVYKIARDDQGNRLTYLKVTGGSLKVKMLLKQNENRQNQEEPWEEKIDQIRIYSGSQFRTVQEAEAGSICAVTGLTKTYSGEGLGVETQSKLPMLEPVLTYQIQLPAGCDVHGMFLKLRQLEEEVPELHMVWNEKLGLLSTANALINEILLKECLSFSEKIRKARRIPD